MPISWEPLGRFGPHKAHSGRSDTGGTDCTTERGVLVEVGTVIHLAVLCAETLDPNLAHIFPGCTRLDPKRYGNMRMRNANAIPMVGDGMTPLHCTQWR